MIDSIAITSDSTIHTDLENEELISVLKDPGAMLSLRIGKSIAL